MSEHTTTPTIEDFNALSALFDAAESRAKRLHEENERFRAANKRQEIVIAQHEATIGMLRFQIRELAAGKEGKP